MEPGNPLDMHIRELSSLIMSLDDREYGEPEYVEVELYPRETPAWVPRMERTVGFRVLGKGGNGCVYAPPFPIDERRMIGKIERIPNPVGKLVRETDPELTTIIKFNELDDKNAYHMKIYAAKLKDNIRFPCNRGERDPEYTNDLVQITMPLAKTVNDATELTPMNCLNLLRSISFYSHHNIHHNDIKLINYLILGDDEIYMADFGLVNFVEQIVAANKRTAYGIYSPDLSADYEDVLKYQSRFLDNPSYGLDKDMIYKYIKFYEQHDNPYKKGNIDRINLWSMGVTFAPPKGKPGKDFLNSFVNHCILTPHIRMSPVDAYVTFFNILKHEMGYFPEWLNYTHINSTLMDTIKLNCLQGGPIEKDFKSLFYNNDVNVGVSMYDAKTLCFRITMKHDNSKEYYYCQHSDAYLTKINSFNKYLKGHDVDPVMFKDLNKHYLAYKLFTLKGRMIADNVLDIIDKPIFDAMFNVVLSADNKNVLLYYIQKYSQHHQEKEWYLFMSNWYISVVYKGGFIEDYLYNLLSPSNPYLTTMRDVFRRPLV